MAVTALTLRDDGGRFAPFDVAVRLWAKVAGPWNTPGIADDACWYFGGRAKNRWGYPRFHWPEYGKPNVGAHVAAYVLTYGPVPDGQVICHRCNHKMWHRARRLAAA